MVELDAGELDSWIGRVEEENGAGEEKDGGGEEEAAAEEEVGGIRRTWAIVGKNDDVLGLGRKRRVRDGEVL